MIKNDQLLKWVMGSIFLLSALLLSSNFEYSRFGFITFAIGHVVGLYVFKKDKAMFWHNFVFLGIDFYGIVRWFIY